jgi:type VI secretion system protein VasD
MLTIYRAVTVAACLSVSACGAWQSLADGTTNAYHAVFARQVKVLDIDLRARAALNPDEASHAVSVAVRVYQLRARGNFDAASYDDLLKNDRTVLGAELADMLTTVVTPGGAASLSQAMRADTQYVGVVGFFRDAGDARDWRRVLALDALSPNEPLRITLVGSELVMGYDAPRLSPP